MGGEQALGALAVDERLGAVVAEGATRRVANDTAWLPDEYGCAWLVPARGRPPRDGADCRAGHRPDPGHVARGGRLGRTASAADRGRHRRRRAAGGRASSRRSARLGAAVDGSGQRPTPVVSTLGPTSGSVGWWRSSPPPWRGESATLEVGAALVEERRAALLGVGAVPRCRSGVVRTVRRRQAVEPAPRAPACGRRS